MYSSLAPLSYVHSVSICLWRFFEWVSEYHCAVVTVFVFVCVHIGCIKWMSDMPRMMLTLKTQIKKFDGTFTEQENKLSLLLNGK